MFGKKGIRSTRIFSSECAAAAKAGYASVDEFVAHVLEKACSQNDDAGRRAADVKKKLEGLGYIS